jgi:branched-chain amino acid transport system substrate-binding protein
MIRRRTVLASAAALPALGVPTLRAATPVKIGVLYPLTGSSASAGQQGKTAVEVALDVVNTPQPTLPELTFDPKGGLPGLGGATIEAVYVDHRGDPAVAQSLTQRLITGDKVAALLGSYQSSTALTATAVAERYGVPFIVSDSVANNITERNFKFTFRVTPIGANFAATYMRFVGDMIAAGHKVDSIALVNENTDYGSQVGSSIEAAIKASKIPLAVRIAYNANGADVSAQVLQLKQANPTVVIFISYASDAILFMRTMKSLDYLPPMILADDAGFNDLSFIPAVGSISQNLMSRSTWNLGPAGSLSARINDAFKAKVGRDMDDASARDMEATFVLADALNRAGSTDPTKLQAALQATDLPKSKMVTGYDGVKFDAAGQNVLGATYLTQLHGTAYATVWPVAPGTAKIIWPMTGWKG